MKVVYLILASNELEYSKDQKAQESTWGQLVQGKFIAYWVFCGASQQEVQSNRIFLPIKESFGNILQKTILATKIIIERDNPDIIIRTNTSSYFNNKKIEKVAKKLLKQRFNYAGFLERYNPPNFKQTEYFVNGSAIYLSRRAQRIIATLNHQDFMGVPDDVAITRALKSRGFHYRKVGRNNICYHHCFYPRAHIRVKGWKNRELTRKRMIAIHAFFTAQGLIKKTQKYLAIYIQEWKYSEVTCNKLYEYACGVVRRATRRRVKERKLKSKNRF